MAAEACSRSSRAWDRPDPLGLPIGSLCAGQTGVEDTSGQYRAARHERRRPRIARARDLGRQHARCPGAGEDGADAFLEAQLNPGPDDGLPPAVRAQIDELPVTHESPVKI